MSTQILFPGINSILFGSSELILGYFSTSHAAKSTALPLRVGRPAGNRFEERDALEAEVQQVDQTHTEGSEEVKGLTDKVTTCRGENTL